MGSVILGNMIASFFQFIYFSFIISSIFFFTVLEMIINPLSTMIYALFYRKELSYKERFLVINYNFKKYYIVIYGLNILIMLFLPDFIYKDYKEHISLIHKVLAINCIIILLYLFIYFLAKKIISTNNIKLDSEEIKLNEIKSWLVKSQDILERFKGLKEIEILKHEEKKILDKNNLIELKNEKIIRIKAEDIQEVFMSICLTYGKYEEEWNIMAIRIIKDMLFIKIELEDKKQKLFTFNKVS